MKFTNFLTVALAGVLGVVSCNAEEAKPVQSGDALDAALKQAVAEKAPSVDELLAFIPEVVVSSGDKALIKRDAFLKDVKPVVEQALAQGMPLDDNMVKGFIYQMAERMSLNTLVLDAAKAKGITANDTECKASLDNLKKQMEQEAPGEFAKELAAMGLDEAGLLEKIRESNIVATYLKGVADAAGAVAEKTEADAKKFYDENPQMFATPEMLSASHILVQFPSAQPTDEEVAKALAKCNDIKAKLAADASNFADLAKEFSDCPSKAQGGNLGQFPQGSMVSEFEAALLALEAGKVSEPVRTQFGYHLILAGEKSPASKRAFDEVKEQLIAYLNDMEKREHDGEAVAAEFDRLRKAANIKINVPAPVMPAMPAEPAPAEK